jgi:hypothetical protein
MKSLLQHRTVQFALVLGAAVVLLANASNPPTGRTGAPFDGHCNGCHSNPSPTFNGTIELSGMPTTIEPNVTYPLTITMTATAGNPSRGGFQMVVVDGNNANAGDLTAPAGSGTGTESLSGREYIEHRNPKNFSGNGSNISWTFNWKSPVSASGNTIKVYYIGNFCNGSGSSGDWMLTGNQTFTLNASTPPVASVSTTPVLCFGGNTGTATATATGSPGPYTYLWSNGQTTSTISNLLSGLYTVTVTDVGTGGTATASGSVTQPSSALTATAAVSNVLTCTNPTATLTVQASGGAPPYQFTWSNGSQGNPAPINVPGVYVVTVTDANNCTKTASASVQQNIVAPVAQATGGVQSCVSNTASVSGQGSSSGANISYLWTAPAGGTIVSGANSINATVTGAGVYVLQVTNTTNGCTSTSSATVTVPAPLVVTATGGSISCSNPSTTLTANSNTPGVLYAWSGPNNFTSTQQNPTVTAIGTYTVIIANPINGCTASTTVQVTGNTAPPIVTVPSATLTCSSPSTNLVAFTQGGGLTYLWNTGSTNDTIVVSSPGLYSVTVTNPQNGCTALGSAAVLEDVTTPTVSIQNPDSLHCNQPNASLVSTLAGPGNATYSYSWSGPGIISGQNDPTAIVNQAGTYSLQVVNTTNGCSAVATTTVFAAPTLQVEATVLQQVSCFGGNNGAAQLNATGGTPPYQYFWPTGEITTTALNLYSGEYYVTVSDANNCFASDTFQITQPAALVVTIQTTQESGPGQNDGTAIALPTGGVAPYTYAWTTSETTASISNLFPGSYTVTVTDSNGCIAEQTGFINSFNCTFNPTLQATNPTCFGANNGTATVLLSNEVLPVTYQWSNNTTAASQINLAPGTYQVTVVDASNCPVVLSTTLTEPSPVTILGSTTPISGFGIQDGTATASATGGTAPYTYLWSTGATTATISGLAVGPYTVTATDVQGCTSVSTVFVPNFNCNVTAITTQINNNCPGGSSGAITASLIGGIQPIGFVWSTGAITESITGLPAGTYSVTLSDAAGCVGTATAVLVDPAPIVATVDSVTNVPCPTIFGGSAIIVISGGNDPAYTLTFPQPGQPLLPAGTYSTPVTTPSGCEVLVQFTIESEDTQAPSLTCPGNIASCDTGNFTSYAIPTASDNCTANIQVVQLQGLPNGSYFPPGVTTQLYQATDQAGNVATCSFTVTTYPTPDVQLVSTIPDQNGSGVGSINVNPIGGTAPYTFAWRKNGQFFANTEDLTGLTAGTYLLVMTDANGCEVTMAAIVLQNVVGTSQPLAVGGMQLSPNPTHSILRLETGEQVATEIAIYDFGGRLIYQDKQPDTSLPILVADWQPGMYLVSITTTDQQRYFGRFIKMD